MVSAYPCIGQIDRDGFVRHGITVDRRRQGIVTGILIECQLGQAQRDLRDIIVGNHKLIRLTLT